MDADFGQQSQAFTLLHDKNMLAPASAASWCPTMDLLALATSDGQLALSRLDWNKDRGERENRLWTANSDSPVTSLGWRPDGKILVSGHADGAVQLYHAEDGEVLHASTPHRGSAVTSLHWQDAPAEDSQTIGVRVSERDVAVRAAHQRRRRRRPRPPEARRRQGGRGCRRGCRALGRVRRARAQGLCSTTSTPRRASPSSAAATRAATSS